MNDFIEFKADIRIFLLFSALNLCGYDFENNRKGMHPVRVGVRKELKRRKLSTTETMKKHFESLPWKIGPQGGQSKLVIWILHFSDPPELQRMQKDWFGVAESSFADFDNVLRDFCFEAGVEELWNQCLPAYQEEIKKYEAPTREEISYMLEYLRLEELPSERIVHIPNLLDSYWTGYGPKIGDNAYVIFGPTSTRPFLGLHEHLHAIVKPMLKKNTEIIRETGHLYSQIKNKMKSSGYDTWDITVEECLIRALSIKLMKAMMPSLSAENSIQRECNHGFVFVRNFYDELATYENSKRTFEEYLPTILETLASENS